MKLGDLIKEYRDSHDLSQRTFATKCELSNGYISMLERGINPSTGKPVVPTLTLLKKLANGMDMTLMSMLDQVDDMPVDLVAEAKAFTGQRDSIDLDALPPNLVPLAPMQRIPLVGTIACGTPILAQENIEGYVDLPKHIKADFALTCEGDSMIDAGIKDGDVVYIRSQPEVQNGQIAAVLVDGESATLKRFFFNDGVVTLMAANQTYPPIVKSGSDVEQVRVLGLAVGLSRSFFK